MVLFFVIVFTALLTLFTVNHINAHDESENATEIIVDNNSSNLSEYNQTDLNTVILNVEPIKNESIPVVAINETTSQEINAMNEYNVYAEYNTIDGNIAVLPPEPLPTPVPTRSHCLISTDSGIIMSGTLRKFAICEDGMVCYYWDDGDDGGMDCTRDQDIVSKYCPCFG